MKPAYILALFLALATSVTAAPLERQVGEMTIRMPSVEGFTEICDTPSMWQELLDATVMPGNERLACFLPAEGFRKATGDEEWEEHELDPQVTVQVSSQTVEPWVSEETFAQFKGQMKNQIDQLIAQAREQFGDRHEKIEQIVSGDGVEVGLEPGSLVSRGNFNEGADRLGSLFLSASTVSSSVDGGAVLEEMSYELRSSTMILHEGTIFVIFAMSSYDGAESEARAKQYATEWAEAFVTANAGE